METVALASFLVLCLSWMVLPSSSDRTARPVAAPRAPHGAPAKA